MGFRDEMSQPLLEADHDSVDHLMRTLSKALERPDAREAFVLLDTLWARLAVHIRAEHLCLFPAILGAATERFTGRDGVPTRTAAEAAIKRLREDHDFFMRQVAIAVNTQRDISLDGELHDEEPGRATVRQIVGAIAQRLDEHNNLEEEQVYTWAPLLLSVEEQTQLNADVRRELENLPPRFAQRVKVS
jgi:hypothetical protein